MIFTQLCFYPCVYTLLLEVEGEPRVVVHLILFSASRESLNAVFACVSEHISQTHSVQTAAGECTQLLLLMRVCRFSLVPGLHPDWMLMLFFAHTHLTVSVTLGLLLIPKVNMLLLLLLISFMGFGSIINKTFSTKLLIKNV